ncbi:hypothetical protein LTR91_007109 [Friedmanniomyces endolithicus]|uniref:Uncharacterized protein n=1 Tax=Friedmanniomyces endolithicus TaxID=329885 RepID=A0A4U0UWH2_9PEZI|nr:hypothetical protein LTS09_004751 [Friedmanniomyces endolithicus]KAK0280448.1 hypothetical protein LTR35_008090 [Friedmanniomyces endolithicus]KAK0282200.1 hypothetical protein LTS00_012315 [Friedmanniomyces endolithicus]KAK0312894.1 hypothetical protein LTR01_002557 [Friedmanniomyces endolithicus]KAK0320448.1 hypothetical protein LTR82_008563 [Friedmanniomyces endolithicus]
MALPRWLLVAGALTWQAVAAAAAPQATASPYDTTTTITAIAPPSTTSSSNNISIISLPSNYTTSNYIAFSPILQSTQTALDVPVGGGSGGSTTTAAAVPITYAIVTTYTPVPSPVTGLTQVSLALPAETLTVTMPTQRTTEAFTLVPVLVTGGAQSSEGSVQTTILAQPEVLSQSQGGSTASHPGGPSPTVLYVATASGASAAAAAGGNTNTHVPGVPLTAGGAPIVVGGTTYSLASSGGALYANGVSTAMPGGVQATAAMSGHAGVAAAVMSAFSTATGGTTGAAASGRTGSAGAGSMATGGSSVLGGSGSAASTLTSAVSGPSRTSGASGAAVQTVSGGAIPALPGLWLSVLGLSVAVGGGLLAV